MVKEVDTVAAISDACVYIPARIVFEALGYDVRWDVLGQCLYLDFVIGEEA